MRHTSLLVVFLALSLAVVVLAKDLSAEWIQVGRSASTQKISLHVALKQRNIELLEANALDVSDPDSPQYGKFLSRDEVMKMISPSKQDHDTVFNFFSQNGCQVNSLSDSLSVACSVGDVESMFRTEFMTYKHTSENDVIIRHMKPYSIPQQIQDRIDILTTTEGACRICRKGGIDPEIVENNQLGSNLTNSFGYIHPAFLRKMYNFPEALFPAKNGKAVQVVAELSGAGFPYYFDLENFANLTETTFANFSYFVNGVGNLYGSGVESTLDSEYIMSLGQGVSTWYYSVNGWMLEMASTLNNFTDLPQVLSLSFGWEEFDQCDSQYTGTDCHGWTPADYIKRANVEFAKLAARGMSVIVASGDGGAPGELNPQCLDQKHPLGSVFPASSPWVTTVSGTTPVMQPGNFHMDLPPLCQQANLTCLNQPVTEIACMWNNTYYEWTTGGGFSIGTDRPKYQSNAVQQYMNQGSSFFPAPGIWNPKGRAYPDISSAGARFLYLVDNVLTIVEGTSAAAPTVSALVSLINDHRLGQGKPALGFLNPLLYKLFATQPSVFRDITVGTNRCTVDGICCPYGYDAAKGYDAVSGLGSIDFTKLFNAVEKL